MQEKTHQLFNEYASKPAHDQQTKYHPFMFLYEKPKLEGRGHIFRKGATDKGEESN